MPPHPERRPSTRRAWLRLELAERMITKLGVDRSALARRENGAVLNRIMRNCFHCQSAHCCRDWLILHQECPDAGSDRCPNQPILEAELTEECERVKNDP